MSLSYRRSFDQVAVSTRVDARLYQSTQIKVDGRWLRVDTSDPFVREVDPWMRLYWARHTVNVRLHGGAYAGEIAHIVVDPDHWPPG